MRLLWGLLLALSPLGAWAGPVLRPAAVSIGPSRLLACPSCGLSRPMPSSVSLSAPVPLSLPIPLSALPAAPQPLAPSVSATLPLLQSGVQAWTESRSDAGRSRAAAVLFEGLPAGDGTPVYPQVATPETMSRDRETAEAAAELRRAADSARPALERSVWNGGWRGPRTTLNDSACGDAAPKLGLLLRDLGHAVDVVEAEFHYYLIQRLPFGEIVVDPTIRQFFGGARAPPDIPKIFVGTVAELNALFARHAGAKTTSYDVSRIYFRDARVRNSKVDELRRLVQQRPESPEYQPLR